MQAIAAFISIVLSGAAIQTSMALPPPEEIPEEVLRTEIITEGRSPIDNEPLTTEEYAELQADLQDSPYAPELSTEVRETIFLLQLLDFFRTFIPILP